VVARVEHRNTDRLRKPRKPGLMDSDQHPRAGDSAGSALIGIRPCGPFRQPAGGRDECRSGLGSKPTP